MRKNSFTLVELLIVIVIIGILATMAIPQYNKMVQKTKIAQAFVAIDALFKAEKIYYLEHSFYQDFNTSIDTKMEKIDVIVEHKSPWNYACRDQALFGEKPAGWGVYAIGTKCPNTEYHYQTHLMRHLGDDKTYIYWGPNTGLNPDNKYVVYQ